MSGYSQASPRSILRSRGTPMLFMLEKQALLGIVRSKSFSICQAAINKDRFILQHLKNCLQLSALPASLSGNSASLHPPKNPQTPKKLSLSKYLGSVYSLH